jgi:hypothetical protein
MSRLTAIISAVVILLLCCVFSWRSGWSSHADHINAQAAKKKEKAEKLFSRLSKRPLPLQKRARSSTKP